MHRRDLLAGIASLAVASRAMAEAPLDRVLGDLERLGYTDFEITTTLLGRTRVVAAGPSGDREVILNRRTGEILRDVVRSRETGGTGGPARGRDAAGTEDDGGRGRGRGRGGDDSGEESGQGRGRGGDDSGGGGGSGRGGDDD